MVSRRDFLKQATLISLAPTVPAFLAQTARGSTPQTDDRILVVIQLGGGNDGLNMVVPYTNDNYYKLRPKIALKKDRVHQLTKAAGLNPFDGRGGRPVPRRAAVDRPGRRLSQSEQVARGEYVDLGDGPLRSERASRLRLDRPGARRGAEPESRRTVRSARRQRAAPRHASRPPLGRRVAREHRRPHGA